MSHPDHLNHKQIVFCEKWLVCRDQVQAYTEAGYAPRGRHGHASRLFNSPKVQAYLKPKLAEISEKAGLTAEMVLAEIRKLALSNPADYFKVSANGKVVAKKLHELTRDQTAAIAEFEPGKKLKLHNKLDALDKLAKHFKLYTDIDAVVNNLVVMPELKLSGKEIIFEVGKPAPKITAQMQQQKS